MIFIENEQNIIDVNDDFQDKLKNIVDFTLKEEGVSIPYEVSIMFVDNNSIEEINKEQRNIDKVTDVLSFPMLDYPKNKVFNEVYTNYHFKIEDLDGEFLVLGDVVLSLEKAKEQSEDFGHSYTREACYLAVHSILHLLGYDHMEEEDKKRMREREEYILEKFDIKREL